MVILFPEDTAVEAIIELLKGYRSPALGLGVVKLIRSVEGLYRIYLFADNVDNVKNRPGILDYGDLIFLYLYKNSLLLNELLIRGNATLFPQL